MNFPLLRQGDKFPAVGVLQKLLNRAGAGLRCDGDFGPRTKAAVVDFQSQRRMNTHGIVDAPTWQRLTAGAHLPIVDCVDVFDDSLWRGEVAVLRAVGSNPIVIGGMSNGVEQAVEAILSQARNVFLLRFHGHGEPGVASIASGHGELDPVLRHRADIASNRMAHAQRVLRRLRPIFGPYGCVQFMHCQTGRGPQGRALLRTLAGAFRVPVTAAWNDQLGGGLTTFAYEGPTVTYCPGGQALGAWTRALPEFPAMTPA